MNKVSIIVPVYNVKKYLKKCVDSIINQTYKEWELILVNDGSTDGSGKLCDDLGVSSTKIKVIHQPNGGLSSARNTGIKNAFGNFLIFVDSDDFLDKQFIENHILIAQQEKADLVVSAPIIYYEGDSIIKCTNADVTQILSSKEALKEGLLQKKFDVSVVGKLYRKELFREIRFPEGEIYEDFAIFGQMILQCNRVAYIDYKGYFYLQREGSIIHSSMSMSRMGLIDHSETMLRQCASMGNDIYAAALYRYVVNHYQILKISIKEKKYNAQSTKIRRNILTHFNEIMKNPWVAIKTKMATIVLFAGIVPYRFIRKIYI